MSRLLRLHTPLQSNFKALFSCRNRLRAINDAILLLAGRCHVGHKNANHLHAHGSACRLVAATQDVALDRAATGILSDILRLSQTHLWELLLHLIHTSHVSLACYISIQPHFVFTDPGSETYSNIKMRPDLRRPRYVYNIKVRCKEVKNTTSLSIIMLLIERHVSAYSEAIVRFNKCQLQETNNNNNIIIIIIGIHLQGRFGQRPELSQATGIALVRCILGKFLGVGCH